ncbi:MAG: DUF2231 domain-containing protein [Candidatus Rokubacteria bacterium]|nr:DUF2231 domain-containing protein [Candidatus Rokubacteria bacterium]
MATPASIRNHPLHPMLVVFPFALWTTAVVFDVVGLVTGNNALRTVAFYNIAAGIVGAVAAAVPGIIDYFSLRGRARRVGTYHAALNIVALLLFTVSWLLRTQWGAGYVGRDSWLPELTAIVGVALIFPSGWLGGSLVYEHGVGVSREPANAAPRTGRRAA